MIEIAVEKRLGSFNLDISLRLDERVTAIFGPSGAGKTTLLSLVAGLIRPQRGRIVVEGRALFDSHAGINLPPHHRRIGYVFQDIRLFPHLSVAANLDYGRRALGLPRQASELERVTALLDIGRLLKRRPSTLSGGEAARVAIGRALLGKPCLLLLDEPLASLDAARKHDILPYLQRLADEGGVPMLYVSHAEEEVRQLAQRIVRIDNGQVSSAG